jgi:hypothetical protein
MDARGAGAARVHAGPRDDVLTTYAPLLLGEATSSAGAIGIAIGAPILLSLPFLAALRREEPELRFDAVAALDELALAA